MATSKLTSYQPFTYTVNEKHSPQQRSSLMWVKRAVTSYRYRCRSVEQPPHPAPSPSNSTSSLSSPRQVEVREAEAEDHQASADQQGVQEFEAEEAVESSLIEISVTEEDASVEIARPWPTVPAA
ncbi:hypothetical protein AaE_011409 [Aphanomyces astaci]|uniref:Uncharacterized protein n=1 Tax=Aphanomyces astaci TaxID=112090 RepID=A0A6A4ZJC1_APHAT|nr:hypothetical protein AaE_011409 [Aphanomyces astaci]